MGVALGQLQVCERLNVMYTGEVVESGPSRQVAATPVHPYTRLLFAATPDISVRRELASIPGAPPGLDAPVVGCPLQPRCNRAFEKCRHDTPVLRAVGPEHKAACHLTEVDGSSHLAQPNGAHDDVRSGP